MKKFNPTSQKQDMGHPDSGLQASLLREHDCRFAIEKTPAVRIEHEYVAATTLRSRRSARE